MYNPLRSLPIIITCDVVVYLSHWAVSCRSFLINYSLSDELWLFCLSLPLVCLWWRPCNQNASGRIEAGFANCWCSMLIASIPCEPALCVAICWNVFTNTGKVFYRILCCDRHVHSSGTDILCLYVNTCRIPSVHSMFYSRFNKKFILLNAFYVVGFNNASQMYALFM